MDVQDQSKTGDESHGHKRVCGTTEGYTKLIESEAISDDENHSDEDKGKTRSPKIEKGIIKESGNNAGGTEERSNRSEDDLFSDAVTEFSDTAISPGATNSPLEISKGDENLEVFENPDVHTKDADKTEENDINTGCNSADTQIKLLDSDSVEMKSDSANAMDFGSRYDDTFEVSDKDQEEQVVYVLSVPSDIPLVDHSETLIDDFKDHGTISSDIPMVLDHDTFEVKTAEDKIQESQTSENGKSSTESAVSEHANTGSSALVPTDVIGEVKAAETKPLEMSKTVPESKDNLIDANVSVDKRFVVILGERTETGEAEGGSIEINRENLEFDHEHAPEVVKETEIDHGDPVLTKEDPASERLSEAYTQEIVKEPESGLEAEQKIEGSMDADSKESGNIGISQRSGKLIPEKAEQPPTASGIVSGTLVDEVDGKLMTNQDSVVDVSVGSSSRNSLEGNWGSVSVLSTASVDVENAHSICKSGIVADKSRLGKSDGFEGQPSLVEPKEEIVDLKCSEPPKSEAKIVNESEGRKRNEEAIAKVANWSTGENSLKNVAKVSNPKELSKSMIQKDEVVEKSREAEKPNLTSETPSLPKYIKKLRKKCKGRGSWVPFVCCSTSSVNVN